MTAIPQGLRTLSTRQARSPADSCGLPLYVTSAKDFYNVETTFTALVVEILSRGQTNRLEYRGHTRDDLIKLHEKQPKKEEESDWKIGFNKFLEFIDCFDLFKSNDSNLSLVSINNTMKLNFNCLNKDI